MRTSQRQMRYLRESSPRARHYRLTAAGRKIPMTETGMRERLSEAIVCILNPKREEV